MTIATASPSAGAESAGTDRSFDRRALDRLLAAPAPAWVRERREAAFGRLRSLGLPDRQDENWMRTDLRLFRPQAWGPGQPAESRAAPVEGLLAAAIAAESAAEEPGRVPAGLAGRVV